MGAIELEAEDRMGWGRHAAFVDGPDRVGGREREREGKVDIRWVRR